MQIDRRELDRELITEIVKIAVSETLMQMGMDTENPKQHQADMIYLRNQREFSEGAKKHTGYGLMLLATVASLGWVLPVIWQNIKEALK